MKIQIKPGLEIGDGLPPFIVAEVGSNWQTLDDCKKSIHMAKACGADAVKFQAFTYESLYGLALSNESAAGDVVLNPAVADTHECNSSRATASLPRPPYLPIEWLPILKEKADHTGIEFMCSAFSPELIAAVDPFVNIHKVASAEMTHVRMLEKLRQIGKPVFLSTGASGASDISSAVSVLRGTGRTPSCPLVLMYCVAAYPAKTIDLYQIHTLRTYFNCLAGYSDHSTDVETIPPLAQSHKAVVIEKHVSFIDHETPDSPHSLNEREFKRMVFTIRNEKYHSLETPVGVASEWKGTTHEETPMLLRHNRRLIATRDIDVGDTLKEGVNFGIYRSLKDDTHAFSPFMVNEVNGKYANRTIQAGSGIGPGDV